MANTQCLTLASNASATGSAATFQGGYAIFTAKATWGGGTVKLQMQNPNGDWLDVSGGSLTADGTSASLRLPPGQYRANIATATAVYAYLASV